MATAANTEPLAPTSPSTPSPSASFSSTAKELIIPQAAAIATVLTKSVLHPIDTIKIRRQAKRTAGATDAYGSVGVRSFYYAYKGQWGLPHLYAGLPIKLLLYAPYQSMYMTSYMWSKPLLYRLGLSAPPPPPPPSSLEGEDNCGESEADPHGLSKLSASSAYAQSMVSGSVKQNKSLEAVTGAVIAEFSCAFIRVPMEVMKVRLQASVTQNTKTAILDLCRQGLGKATRLVVPQTLCHDLPYSITQWLVYEHVRPIMDATAREWRKGIAAAPTTSTTSANGSSSSLSSPSSSYFSYTEKAHWWFVKLATFGVGASSGLVAGIVTVPLDNIKTRVIVQSNTVGGAVPSFVAVGRDAVQREGLRGILRGGSWRVLWITTNTAFFFPIFDCVKEVLARID